MLYRYRVWEWGMTGIQAGPARPTTACLEGRVWRGGWAAIIHQMCGIEYTLASGGSCKLGGRVQGGVQQRRFLSQTECGSTGLRMQHIAPSGSG